MFDVKPVLVYIRVVFPVSAITVAHVPFLGLLCILYPSIGPGVGSVQFSRIDVSDLLVSVNVGGVAVLGIHCDGQKQSLETVTPAGILLKNAFHSSKVLVGIIKGFIAVEVNVLQLPNKFTVVGTSCLASNNTACPKAGFLTTSILEREKSTTIKKIIPKKKIFAFFIVKQFQKILLFTV